MKLVSTSPFGGFPLLGEVEASSFDDVQRVIAQAREAQRDWAATDLSKRCQMIRSFIEIARSNADEIALLTTRETGRPIASSRGIVSAGLAFFEAYLDMAEDALAPRVTLETETEIHRIVREPWGVVAAICPWNFPFLNVPWQCGQALTAGNAIVYKNSENNPLFGRLLQELLSASELPQHVFAVLHGDEQVGRWMVEARVDLITFTGSTEVGRQIAARAAERLIPFVGELGGSAPCIVFDDVNLDSIIGSVYANRFVNSGQSCDAIKRLIVHESRFDEVVQRLTSMIDTAVVGDPLDERTTIGPLVSMEQRDRVEDQVHDAVDRGARVVIGGHRPIAQTDGAYYAPTLLVNVTTDMRVWREEVFGPVLPVVMFRTEDEAVSLANDTQYGLGAWVMTDDTARFERVASRIESGIVTQNNVEYWSPHNPFGGYKQSGLGRVHGEHGFHEMTQMKLVSSSK